ARRRWYRRARTSASWGRPRHCVGSRTPTSSSPTAATPCGSRSAPGRCRSRSLGRRRAGRCATTTRSPTWRRDRPALATAVADHPAVQSRMLAAAAPLPPPADPVRMVEALDAALAPAGGPFDRHPLARYRWAWTQLAARTGRHLDLGVGDGTFTAALHRE